MIHITGGQQLLFNSSFSIRKLYLGLRRNTQSVAWHRIIGSNVAPPKCIFIVWLAMLGRLSTCDNLGKVGIHVDPICSLCSREEESVNHLFFKCEFSRIIWDLVAEWSGVHRVAGDWEIVKNTLIMHCGSSTGKQKLFRLVLSVVVYQIWMERNKRKLQGLKSNIYDIVKICRFQIAICCSKDSKLARFLSLFQ